MDGGDRSGTGITTNDHHGDGAPLPEGYGSGGRRPWEDQSWTEAQDTGDPRFSIDARGDDARRDEVLDQVEPWQDPGSWDEAQHWQDAEDWDPAQQWSEAGEWESSGEWEDDGSWAEEPAPPRKPTYRLTRRGKVVFTVLPLLIVGSVGLASSGGEPFTLEGLAEGAVLGAEAAGDLRVDVVFERAPDPEAVTATLGDVELPVSVDGTTASIDVGAVAEGEHVLTVSLDRLLGSASATRTFSVDTTPPTVTMAGPTEAARVSQPMTLLLSVDDPGASVSVEGQALTVVDGVAELDFERPPRAPVTVTAVDTAGNAAETSVLVPVALPGEPGQEPMRGVHASGWTWTTAELKDPIMDMIDAGLINTVQIDLKDEAGDVWYDTSVELAHEMGAVTELWDLAEVVEELHALDVRVVGRIVNFRDPRLATYAVENGKMDWIVQTPEGGAYGKYGGFANPFSQEVWEYNIELAEEAARLGVDDILYDYVRRPDDYLENMRFPLQDGDPELAIIGFLEESRHRVHAAGARLGASVFGIAATRPEEIAQNIPEMSKHVDYIAPMVYPSHWGPGEYGVADPNSQPYDIVYESMKDFVVQVEGTGATLVSWLQDFSLGVDYGPAEVRAQIQASIDAGVPDFLLWDAATTYTRAALE